MSKEGLVFDDADASGETIDENGKLRLELVALKISYQDLQVGVRSMFFPCFTVPNFAYETGAKQ